MEAEKNRKRQIEGSNRKKKKKKNPDNAINRDYFKYYLSM